MLVELRVGARNSCGTKECHLLSTQCWHLSISNQCCPTTCWILQKLQQKIFLTCKVKTFMLSKTIMFTNVFNHVGRHVEEGCEKANEDIYKEDNVGILHVEV